MRLQRPRISQLHNENIEDDGEREREIQYVHLASLTYEDGALFMSQPSESRLSYSHRQPAGPCAKQKMVYSIDMDMSLALAIFFSFLRMGMTRSELTHAGILP